MREFMYQDSDWPFDDADFPAIVVSAADEKTGAFVAAAELYKADPGDGGVHFKVADAATGELLGFIGAEWINGTIYVDEEFQQL